MKTNLPFLYLLVFFGSLFLSGKKAQAQQESKYTQYMYNVVGFNPAYAGSRGSLSIIGLYRSQWVGLDGAPKTLSFSAHSPIGVRGVGGGLDFVNDQIGPVAKNTVTADFSYTLRLNNEGTKLAFGIKAGLSMLDIDMNKLSIYNPNDDELKIRHTLSPVVGIGFFLYDKNWFAGLSSPNILGIENFGEVEVSTGTEKLHGYLIAGYVFDVSLNTKLKPSILLKGTTGAPVSINTSISVLFHEIFTLGAVYQIDAAVGILAGFQISDQIRLGYAYDFNTTELNNYNSGSHEFSLRFELGTRKKPRLDPRFF